jgi:hypothetical protein
MVALNDETKDVGELSAPFYPDHPVCYGSGGCKGLPLDFDYAAFYRRFDRFSTRGRQMRSAGRDHGAIVLGGSLP